MRLAHHTVPSALLLLLVTAGALCLSSRTAAAQVVVAVGGDADEATRTKLTEAISDGLRDQRAELSDQKLKAADVDLLIDCISDEASQDCAAKFMASTKASRAFVMRVVNDRGGAKTIYGWVIATAGDLLVVNQRVCEKCSTKQLIVAANALLAILLKDVEARTLPTTLAVRSTPPGAQVEIDGRIVGVTPLEHGVYAGEHRIVLHLRGYEESIQERNVLAGETTAVEVKLKATSEELPDETDPNGGNAGKKDSEGRVRWKPWTVIGAGGLIAVAGGVLVALDEDGGEGMLQFEHRETMALGLGGVGVGLAVAAVGVVWLLRSDDGRAQTPTGPTPIGPTVSVDGDRVLFGYGGAF